VKHLLIIELDAEGAAVGVNSSMIIRDWSMEDFEALRAIWEKIQRRDKQADVTECLVLSE